MSQDIPGLMGFVVRELKANPDCSSSELYERGLDRYPGVASLTVRGFHGRYVIRVRKQMRNRPVRRFPFAQKQFEVTVPESPVGPEPSRPEPWQTQREALRLLLFRLAMDFETSPSDSELVDVVARLDKYVEEGLAIVGG